MYTYQIKGQVNWNDAETEDGNLTVEIDETVNTDQLGADVALGKFFAENGQYDDFFYLKTCGEKGASFVDRTDNNRRLDVDLIQVVNMPKFYTIIDRWFIYLESEEFFKHFHGPRQKWQTDSDWVIIEAENIQKAGIAAIAEQNTLLNALIDGPIWKN